MTIKRLISKFVLISILLTQWYFGVGFVKALDYQEMLPEMFQANLDLGTLMDYKKAMPESKKPAKPAATGDKVDSSNPSAGNKAKDSGTITPGSKGWQDAVPAPKYLAQGKQVTDPGFLVARVIANILFIAGIIAVIMIIISGIQYIMAYGKDENIEAAKKTLTWTILGLLAIIFAYFIVENIITYLYTEVSKQ